MYQYRTFGSIELALAAYNAGPNNVRNGNYLYFSETQGYINKVPRLIQKYQRIFAQTKKV
jgi:soluble lytic murein transglycosylase-like protein